MNALLSAGCIIADVNVYLYRSFEDEVSVRIQFRGSLFSLPDSALHHGILDVLFRVALDLQLLPEVLHLAVPGANGSNVRDSRAGPGNLRGHVPGVPVENVQNGFFPAKGRVEILKFDFDMEPRPLTVERRLAFHCNDPSRHLQALHLRRCTTPGPCSLASKYPAADQRNDKANRQD